MPGLVQQQSHYTGSASLQFLELPLMATERLPQLQVSHPHITVSQASKEKEGCNYAGDREKGQIPCAILSFYQREIFFPEAHKQGTCQSWITCSPVV